MDTQRSCYLHPKKAEEERRNAKIQDLLRNISGLTDRISLLLTNYKVKIAQKALRSLKYAKNERPKGLQNAVSMW